MRKIVFQMALAMGLSLAALGAERPNILLIVSEDNGPELGCYGEPYVKTPVLDELAAAGVRFDRAFVPQAGCSQSRAALLTGLYPHQNGQIGLATWKFRLYDENTPNLVRSLIGAGYRTGIIGKLHINPESAFPFDFKAISSANFGRKNLNQYAAKAKEFIEASDRPFFLSVNYPDAHRPFIAKTDGLPERPLTGDDVEPLAYFGLDSPELRQQTADYYNCMSRLDSMIGDLLAVLDESGKRENTLIVYMGDHGADMLRGKRTSYEGGVRIPLILNWKGIEELGRTSEKLVSTLDLMPTLLKVADAEAVDGLPGHSLVPFLKKESTEWRCYLFTEYHLHSAHNYFPQRTVRDERFKLVLNLMPETINPGYAFTNNRFFDGLNAIIDAAPEPVRSAYQRMERPPQYELYDLEADPHEFTNLAEEASHAEVLTRLQGELESWREQSDDPMLRPENVKRLKDEIDASMEDGTPTKARLQLNYPNYFFSSGNRGEATEKKNVLFIAIDDLRPALGCYGDKTAITPNIDRLASRGTVFNRAYCQLAVCAPSRLSLMTGRRPDTIRVWDLGTHFRNAAPEVVTLPQHFKLHGYETRSIGKIYHGGGAPSKDPLSWTLDPIFDINLDPELRYATPENLDGKGLKRRSSEAAGVPDDTYIDGLICQEALDALDGYAESGEPFFLAVGFKKPHLPFCAPKRYWDLYARESIPPPSTSEHPKGAPELAWRSWKELEGYTDIPADGVLSPGKVQELRHGYYACVSYIDAQVGRLLDQLDASGLSENTVICLWGDHGFHLGEQGLWTKANNYELSTRVPLIFVDPMQTNRGAKTNALVELVDLYPSLAESCDLEAPVGVEGISFMPLLENPDLEWKTAAFSQYPRARKGNRHRGHGDIMGYAVRTDRFRYVEWREWQSGTVAAVELYDHRSDSNEIRNIAEIPEQSESLRQLQAILKNGWNSALPAGTARALKR